MTIKCSNFLCLFLSIFLFFQSFPLLAETCLYSTKYDISYNPDYQGYVSKNIYEQKGKILYIVNTVESGPYVGVQLFCNYSEQGYGNIAKYLPDSYIEANGIKYSVYDYVDYLICHCIDDEILIVL